MPQAHSNASRHASTWSLGMPRENGRTAPWNSEGPTTSGRDWEAAHGSRPSNGPPSESSSSSSTDHCRGDAASAGNVVAGSVAQDAAQDTVMSGDADGRRSSPRDGHNAED